jgi:CHAT domain-containing protein
MRQLDAALVRPFGAGGKRLVIVSTGVLGQLPWGGLPSLSGVPVVVAPSATSWLAATRAPRRRRRAIHALAGPGVPFGDRELKGVASSWTEADVRVGLDADRRALVTALNTAEVVHVAAHGVHQTENAMFSSLRMADGLVFAHELDRTTRTAEHVILSACELGLATVRPGDEALGLSSVLLRLGTRSVVAGVARVGDEIAAETMTAYHRYLAAGDDSAAALACALADVDGVAPFVCLGSAWQRVRVR